MITIPSPSAILVIWIIVLTVLACVILSVVVTLSSRKAEAYDVYDLIEPFAKNIKITLQMFIGFGLTGLIILKILHQLQWSINNTFLNDFVYMSSTLAIVAAALAYSSAIELAYTLFTKGPDEAVDPLMLGLAAAILLSISKTEVFDVTFGEAMAFYVAGLAGLFAIKRFFIDSKATQKADAAAPQPLLAIRRFFDDLRNTQKASSTATQRPSTLLGRLRALRTHSKHPRLLMWLTIGAIYALFFVFLGLLEVIFPGVVFTSLWCVLVAAVVLAVFLVAVFVTNDPANPRWYRDSRLYWVIFIFTIFVFLSSVLLRIYSVIITKNIFLFIALTFFVIFLLLIKFFKR